MVMTSVSGHLLQLEFLPAYRNWKSVNPISLFDAPVRKSCNEDFQKIKKTLEREIRGCNGLIIWTDCDREGENIGFEIVEVCQAIKPGIKIFRAKFSEITTAGVERALNSLVSPDNNMNNAVNIRTELDLRTGAALTRFQTLRLQRAFPTKIDNLISYGSCQIPTLGFVCERYKEVEAFVSEPFWKVKVTHTLNELTVEFNWSRNRLFDKEACEDYLIICLARPTATVEKTTTKPKSKWRPKPMDTVEMEKLSSRKLKLAAKDTMTIAEKLYTQGYISYPRTETNMFSKEIDLKKLVELHEPHPQWGQFASRVLASGPNPRNGSKTDQAHPPIHPTKIAPNLKGNEARLYELISRHFLACVSKDAVGSETVVNIDLAGEKFTATGLVILERNYLDVYIYEKWNAKEIHLYEEGQQFQPDEISLQEGTTTAPPLLTEADLITLMDKNGIGTDATHAEHINTIKERGYIGTVDNGFLVPGCIGMGLYEGYVAMDLALAKPNLRAEFEEDLKKICAGTKDFKQVLQEQILKYKEAYRIMEQRVLSLDEKMGARLSEIGIVSNENSTPFLDIFKCPKCKIANMALKRTSTNFPYISCLNFPECKNSVWFSKDVVKDVVLSDKKCQKCGDDVHKFKIMFTNMYYKALFDVPVGWYETCLRCDSKLRNALAINLDQIKSTGRIIQVSTAPVTGVQAQISSSMSLHNYSTNNSSKLSGNRRNNQGLKKSNSYNKNESKAINTRPVSTYLRSEPKFCPERAGSSQHLFSDEDSCLIAAFEAVEGTIPVENVNNTSNETDDVNYQPSNFDLDNMFDNDFDEIDFSVHQNNKEISSDHVNYDELFEDDNVFNTNDVEDMAWEAKGSRANAVKSMGTETPSNEFSSSTSSNYNQRESNDMSQSKELVWDTKRSGTSTSQNSNFQSNYNPSKPIISCESEYIAWGTKGFRNNKQNSSTTGAGNKRFFPTSGSSTSTKENSWGSSNKKIDTEKENQRAIQEWTEERNKIRKQEAINRRSGNFAYNKRNNGCLHKENDSKNTTCPKCKTTLSALTVKKEGPNTGRQFFSCRNSCNFFQWTDEISNSSSYPKEATSNETIPKPRAPKKCTLCRQEGHTKVKCPTKNLN
ncbi:TOP3A family protein [Megaselia abdita]